MALSFNLPGQERSIIKVIGVGGGGGNAVETMFQTGIRGVEYVICNTDAQVLNNSPIPNRIQIGAHLTNGLGCGAKPEVGRHSAIESIEEIQDLFRDGTKMVFVTAGMGGGTGTGAAPVIAALAREMGILTIGIVTTPFGFEGRGRKAIADEGLEELRHCVDSLLVIDNNNLLEISNRNMKARDSFKLADSVLSNAARGIAEMITVPGQINVDFADVQTIMKDSGTALMGMASYAGENRALMAVEEALASPLLNNADIHGAKGLLVNICAHPDSLMMSEIEIIMNYLTDAAGDSAFCIFGTVDDETMGDELRVTVVATGFETHAKQQNTSQSQSVQQRFAGTINPVKLATERNRANTRRHNSYAPQQPELFKSPQNALSIPAFQQNSQQPTMEMPTAPQEPAFEAPMQPEQRNPEPPRRQEPPTPPLPREMKRVTPEERMERLSNLGNSYDYRNPNRLVEMENQPAWKRRGLQLEVDNLDSPRSYSRLSVDAEAGTTRFSLRDNSFLFDNVD